MRITKTLSLSGIVFLIVSVVALVFLAGPQLDQKEPFFVDWHRDESHGDPLVSYPNFRGKTMQTVFDELGPPYSINKLKLTEGMLEFHCELQNFYPQDRPENRNITLREVRWVEGDYWLFVWFHKVKGEWMFLDAIKYPPKVIAF